VALLLVLLVAVRAVETALALVLLVRAALPLVAVQALLVVVQGVVLVASLSKSPKLSFNQIPV
jgi:hypothetical protein